MKRELQRIKWMNETFKLDSNDKPTDLGPKRLLQFYWVLRDELDEILEAYFEEDGIRNILLDEEDCDRQDILDSLSDYQPKKEVDFVALADLLGDIKVYNLSEARRWGIPIKHVFHAIMDSQESKLVDGKPLIADDGSKFIKGPDYQPPEERIKGILLERQLSTLPHIDDCPPLSDDTFEDGDTNESI